jgi:hypothetical protein
MGATVAYLSSMTGTGDFDEAGKHATSGPHRMRIDRQHDMAAERKVGCAHMSYHNYDAHGAELRVVSSSVGHSH